MTLAQSKDRKLEAIFENTAQKTPQKNSYAELAFTVIAMKTLAIMNVAQNQKASNSNCGVKQQ